MRRWNWLLTLWVNNTFDRSLPLGALFELASIALSGGYEKWPSSDEARSEGTGEGEATESGWGAVVPFPQTP